MGTLRISGPQGLGGGGGFKSESFRPRRRAKSIGAPKVAEDPRDPEMKHYLSLHFQYLCTWKN